MHKINRANAFLLAPRNSTCITCPSTLPCSCATGQVCERTVQTCSACASNICIAGPNTPSGNGVSNGALAGAILGCVFLLTLVVTGFFVWRRRVRAQKAAALALEKTTISPIDLQGPNVLHAPLVAPPGSPGYIYSQQSQSPTSPNHSGSPVGDVRIYNNSVINLDPATGQPSNSPTRVDNPFNDSASMSTMGTNVIPIAYVPPNSTSMSVADGMGGLLTGTSSSAPPSRPARSPDLDLRLPPQAVSRASMIDNANSNELLAPRSPYTAQSTKSAVSGVSSRASTMSGVSSVYDRPMIVTSTKVGRQVLGVVRAEVVPAPSMPSSPNSPLRTPTGGARSLRARASVRSPLAGPSFSPGDIELRHSPSPPPPIPGTGPPSPSMSLRSNPFSDLKSAAYDGGYLNSPVSPTAQPLPPSRSTTPGSPTSSHSANENNDGRLLTPRNDTFPPEPTDITTPKAGHFPRESASSFISATSRADSIINQGFVFYPATPGSTQNQFAPQDANGARRVQGFSTYSTASNVSSGLGAFPFHFGSGHGGDTTMMVGPESARNTGPPAVPHSLNLSTLAGAGYNPQEPAPRTGPGAVRASLDTLALSRDVEAYPLAFDRPMNDRGAPRPSGE